MKDYRKTVIPKDDYLATIVFAEFAKRHKKSPILLYLWWVIDTGKYIDQKISQEIPCTEFGDDLLLRMCKRIKTNFTPTITTKSTIFPLQFYGYRGKLSVDIQHDNGFTRNIITHHQPALAPPEKNVIRSKAVDHFYQEQAGRKLPIG